MKPHKALLLSVAIVLCGIFGLVMLGRYDMGLLVAVILYAMLIAVVLFAVFGLASIIIDLTKKGE